jgi:hypothetical protein
MKNSKIEKYLIKEELKLKRRTNSHDENMIRAARQVVNTARKILKNSSYGDKDDNFQDLVDVVDALLIIIDDKNDEIDNLHDIANDNAYDL